METSLVYMPVFRVRAEEVKLLKSFEFGNRIYPCLEIVKEKDRKDSKKSFEQIHRPLIKSIQSETVFIDIPMHFKTVTNTNDEVIKFMRKMTDIDTRIKYMQTLSTEADKIIPVISSYFHINGKTGSLKKQSTELRKNFPRLAFRIFSSTFESDLDQVEPLAQQGDYLIVDFGEKEIDRGDDDTLDIINLLSSFNKCEVIIVRSAVPGKLTNVELPHDDVIPYLDNGLMNIFRDFHASAFGDYAGIKKDNITEGGTISPGFVYYDSIRNEFYGYKGMVKELSEFSDTIIPAVLASDPTGRMQKSTLGFLSTDNEGWNMLQRMDAGIEPSKSMGKFKRISMEHYVHCIRTMIDNGDFD